MFDRQYIVDDLTIKDTWRIFLIMAEFVEGDHFWISPFSSQHPLV